MRIVKPKGTATVVDLLKMSGNGLKRELVNGEVVASPAGWTHSEIETNIIVFVSNFLREHPIGKVAAFRPQPAISGCHLYSQWEGTERRETESFSGIRSGSCRGSAVSR